MAMILFCLFALLRAGPAQAQAKMRIEKVAAFWEDSLAIVQPTIESPLSPTYTKALRTGVSIRYDFEMQLFRTGFSKTIHQEVTVEYNVWTDRYRVVAPIGRLAIESLSTVEKYFRDGLILILHPSDIPREEAWFVRVRVEAYPVTVTEDGSEEVGSLERELQGITGWLFRRGRSKTEKSGWSKTTRLPEAPHSEARP